MKKLSEKSIIAILLVACVPLSTNAKNDELGIIAESCFNKSEMQLGKKANSEEVNKTYHDDNGMASKRQTMADSVYFKNEGVKCFTDKDDFVAEAKKQSIGAIDGVNIVVGNYRLEMPIDIISVEGSQCQLDPSKNTMSLEIINFGEEGNTVLLHLNAQEIDQDATLSYSGKNIRLGAGIDSGNKMIVLLRGQTPCAVLMLNGSENKRIGMILKTKGAVSNFSRGMLRAEVEKECSTLGLSQFKFTRDSGKYKVYSLYWLDMQKQYDIFGDYHYNMRNDKKWGEFYFDSQDRLMKWILYM
ncbi:MAG: hypothetical protein J5965_24915 [Aeriscardovia sp.]|nr:hypothetical protein [Aeriscardovia sp.]MBP3211557.1 hypothetical protein [Prevotella sp.]